MIPESSAGLPVGACLQAITEFETIYRPQASSYNNPFVS